MALHPKVKQLYDTLKGGGADVGTEQEFNSWFFASGNTGYQNRKQVWQTLKDGGADAGNSYEEFAGWLGLQAVKPKQQKPQYAGPAWGVEAVGKLFQKSRSLRPDDDLPPRPLDRKKAGQQLQQNQRDIERQQAKQRKQVARQQRYTEQRMKDLPGGMDRVEDRAKEYLATGEASPVPIAPNPEVVRGDMVMDENGQMRQSYMTPTGDYSSRAGAEAVEYRNAHPLEDELQQAYLERERLQEELGRAGNEAYNTYVGSGAGFMPLTAQGLAMHNSPEFSMLSSAYHQNELRIKTLERERDADGFWRTLGKELFSLDTWDFGAQEFMDAGNLLRFGEGDNLTDEQQEARESMLLNTFRRQGADQQYGENDTFMQSSATITANAIPFVVQFLATGGMETVTAAGAKLGSKMAAKAAAKGFTGNVSQWIIRNTGVAAGDVAAGFLMANTVGGFATSADIMGRHQGQVVQGPDGMLRFEGGKSWGRSIYEGEVANTLEYYTEMLGAHMDGMGTAIGAFFSKGAGKVSKTAAGKGLQELADKVGITKLSELFSRIKGSEFRVASSHLLKSGGINEIPSEILEEEANLILNAALVGDNQWSDLKDWDKTQRDIIGGMFLSVGFMQSPGAIGGVHQAAQYYRYKQNTDLASARASALFGADRWNALKDGLDESNNGDFMDIVHTVLIDESINDEQRGAVVEYAKNVLKMRGYNLRTLADAKDKADEGSSPDDEGANSYHEGYNMPDEEQAGVKVRVDVARAWLYNLGFDDSNIESLGGEMPEDWLAALSDEQREAVEEYRNAMAAYDGMVQHVQDDMEGAIAESEATVEQRTHPETGAVHRAELKTGGEVWIVGGNVAIMPDGAIDIENSDGDLIVLDPATGDKRMIHVSDLASADEPVMADQLKQQAAADIQETMATVAANRIDGVLQFQPGDVYSDLPFGEEVHTIQVIADGEDGVNVVVSVDGGEQQLMPMQMIQEAADAQREARIAEQAAVAATAAEPQPTGQEDITPADDEAPQSDAGVAFNADYSARIKEWLSEENLEWSEGKSREEIFAHFGNELEPIATIPSGYLRHLGTSGDNKVYSGKGYFIDHAVNHHDEEPVEEYLKLQEILNSPDDVKLDTSKGRPTLLFIKKYGKYYVEMVSVGDDGSGRVVLHKSFFHRKKMPHKGLPSVTLEEPSADGVPAISPSSVGNEAGSSVFSALDGEGKGSAENPDLQENLIKIAAHTGFRNEQDLIEHLAGLEEGGLKQWIDDNFHPQVRLEVLGTLLVALRDYREVNQAAPTMPMNGDEVDWFATSPERGHRYLYEEAGLSPEEADAVVANSVKDAEKELEKVSKKAPKPGNAAQLNKYRAEKAAHEQQVAAAQAAVDYWKGVQAVQQQVVADLVRRQADERAAQDAAARQAAIEAEAQYQAEQEAKKAEQAERGPFSVGAAVTEKWNAAPKTDGVRDQIKLADGTAINGHYVLVEAGAATPSHDPQAGWKQSDGFPVNENGGTVNDRDYERDQAAQDITREMARTYDSRAVQTVPVVSADGVVLSGNGRTIAGDLAAQAGTDGAYIDYLREFGGKYGFTADQVGAMQHPRVLFVPDEAMPYTPETFARFNAQEMKGQNLTESAVKLGKTVDDATFNDVVGLINQFDTMGDFYAHESAPVEAINKLRQAGVINAMQYTQMFDGDKVSGQGKEVLENMLLGKAFEGNPDAVRQLMDMPSVRRQVVVALAEIANNSRLGDFSLEDLLSQSIDLVYKARNAKNKVKQGESVLAYAQQLSLFPDITGSATVADINNTAMVMIADILNDHGTNTLKYILTKYNYSAGEAIGMAGSLFIDESPEGILQSTIEHINELSNNELKQEINAAVEQRKSAAQREADSGQEAANAGAGSDAAAERPAGRQGDLAQAEVSAPLSDEVNEFGVPFVLSSDGTTTFGEVTVDSGLKTAPIKLSLGENSVDDEGINHGYGYLHIGAGHGQQILSPETGFKSIEEFVETVARNYDTIREGNQVAGNQTYLLELSDEHNNTLFIQLSHDGSYWNVNSAGIFRKKYSRRMREVASLLTIGNSSSTETVEVNRGQKDGATATSENSSLTSEGKGSTENANVQGNSEKNVGAAVAQAEAEVDTEPTEGQKEAGNYRKGHVKIDGFDVTIEQPKGSVRSGVDASGKAWSQEMHNTYGYIRGTEGVDGDHIDVFLSDHLDDWNGMVYVVDQVNKDGSFDEHKVMYGFDSEQEAREAYLSNYEEGWTGLGNITGVTRDEFRKWVDSSHRKTKPFAEYKSVRATGSQYTDNTSRPIQGLEGYTEEEILEDVRAFIVKQLEDAGIEGVTIKGMALHGSRMRGDARPDSDLDVVVEYEGDISEDAFFNLVNYDLNFRGPNGIIIDINPITRGKSGTLEQYMERSRRYDEEKRGEQTEATEPAHSTDTGDQAYTITPTKYTTKKNKELDVWLVKFSGEIDKKQATEIAKETRGWWDREHGGFLMRSEEAARDLAERVAGATSQSNAIPEQNEEDLNNGFTNFINSLKVGDDVMYNGYIAEISDIITFEGKPDRFKLNHIKKQVLPLELSPVSQADASENASKPASEEPSQSAGTDNQATTDQAGPKRLVSDERMAELKERLRKKLGGQLNVGVDPELLAIGAELAVGHIERGLTKFADYAKAMLEDVGDVIRPYLKSFYNAVREMPEAEEYAEAMTPYDEVRKFDIANFDKEGPKDVIATAKSIVDEQKVEKDALEITEKAKKTSKKKKKDVSSQEQATPSLFSDEELNSNDNDTATTRPAERESREDGQVGNVPADGNGVLDTDGSGRVDGGEPASVSGTSSPVADGARTGIPRRRSGGSAARGNDVASEAEQPVSDGGRGVRDGASADGRNDAGGAASTTGSVQEKPRGRGGNVKPSSPKPPKFKRNYLYPENASEIDNMSPQQRLKANVEALELLRDLMRDGREAVQDEKAVLGRYRGWGGVDLGRSYSTDAMRHSYTDRWSKPTEQGKLLNRLADVIDELDPEGERGVLQAINRAVLTSYYTPTGIARAMNRFIELAGFKGGTMLDPSMGNGVFEGTMSKGVQQSTMIHGVELDWLTGQIARRLYPDANVLVTGYEQAGTADNAYDVVISNIPFGDISITDKSWKHDSSPVRRAAQNKIHNYFAVKMLDNTSPGGLCVIMTSNAILDTKGNKLIRQYLADNAEVLGCVRLPDNTFKGAGTQVVTDVIFLRKYKDDADREATRSNTDYIDKIERPLVGDAETIKLANPSDGKTYDVAVNGYYQSNAKMMIGTPVAGGQYRADQFGLTSDLDSDKLASAFAKLIEKSIIGNRKGKLFDTHKSSREVHQAVSEAYKGDGTYISSGNIVEQDGMFGVVTSTRNKYGDVTSTFTEVPSFKSKGDRIRSMLPIRHAMKQVIDWQIQGMKEQDLSQARAALQKAYDDFVKKFGRLNDKANDFLTEDIDGYTLRSLEKWQDGKFAGLSDIFTKNTIKPAIDLTTAKTPREAISLSLAEYGEINPSFMEEILGSSWVEQCGESLYRLPFTQDRYVTDDAYLSGDVKTKLDQARTAAERDKAFERNVAALEAVQPEDIPFADINIRMGARWVPVEVYTDFMYHLFGIRKNDWKGNKSGVAYLPEADEYKVNVASNELGGEADAWRTSRLSASEIFEAALKDKTRKVYDTIEVDGVEKKVLNKEQTELANGKIQDIRTAFEDWLSQDPNREEMLMRLYNDKFNRIVLRKFDGSHLNVAGLMGKELRPHQKDAVWMLINNRGGIVDHIVGAGKTLVMQSAIMEMRRMGIAKKPMIIGLKATVGQIAKEFREAFPAARILAPTEKDFSKENRKKFMSQIALNDYDCVVLSHDQYCMLPHTEEVERRVIDEQMAQLDAAIEFLYGQSDKSQLTKKQIKGLEKRKANLEAKLASLLDRKIDREFTFEGLGVDYLFVDECQHFKSLPYVSSYDRVAGLGDKKGSQRAIALLNGVRYLQSMHQGDRGTVFLSGTTISNSLSEIYHLLNYLRPSEMERLGMTTFDAWAGNFAIHTSELEAGVTNEWKEKDRFRSLTNIPELSKMYAEIADVRNDMNLKLPKPKMRSHIVTVPQTDVMKEINAQIVEMVKTKNGHYFDIASTDKTPWGLLASTLSAKAAINPRLISEDYGDEGGKIPAVCDKVKEIYDKFAAQKGTQLIFCDTGVPQKGKSYDAYTDIINRLVNDYGIPRNEIADIHEADTDEKRKALFAKVNDGAVRILIGGTKNMGTGVNVQRRIVAMHHVDVPWTPADREQREGRGVRQGNEIARDFNDDNVDVYFYATEGSLDMYKYQLQEIKGKLFAQFKSGTIGDRTFDEGDAEGDFDPAEVVAMLSGNPIVLDKSRQDKLVEKLRRAKRAYDSDWQRRRTRYEYLQRKKSNFERLISLNQSDARALERGGFVADANGKYPATVTVAVNGDYSTRRTFDKPKEAGAYIHELLKKGKVVELSGFGQKATITKPITDAGLFGKPVASMENYGGIKYTVEVSDDDTAAGVAFRNLLQKVYSNGKVYERNLEDVNNQLVGADPGEKAFPKQAELDAAVEKKKELDSEYKKLSDDEEKPSEADVAAGDEVLFRELDDEENAELIAELESGPTVTTYSTKVKVDGGYIPPMSSKDNETGKMRKPEREGTWNEAEERPDMAYFDEKSGKWKFDLKKSNNKTTGHVDYNPYGHSGSGMLNDQFSEAQSRPDLVVVEMAVPESEVTSGYKAEKANDPVGWKPWKAGPITAKMTGTRQVMLSRWHKITREVPWPEVAQSVARDLGNQFDVLPTNTFPVQLRAELEKLGYQFIETNNKGVIQEGPYKGLTWTDRYYDIHPELDKRKDRKKRAAHTAAVLRANSAQYTDNAENRLREALVEGGRLAIIEQGGKWRVEGMPGEFGSRYAAIDEWRERAEGNVVWYLSEDGNFIEVEGNGDMYEMLSGGPQQSRGTENRAGRARRERMARWQRTREANGRRMVDELAEKLGVKVRYVDDMTEEERAQFSERQLRSKGWYNPRTGEVFINLGRHTRLYDILSTFLHETVAHKGLRRLFGKDFNTFLDNVYNNANEGIRAEIGRMAEQQKRRATEDQRARHDDEHWRRVATEEYMAKLAERLDLNHPEERTLWEKIKGFLLDKLRKIGVTVADSLSDNDLRGILWESYHSMESEGVIGYAKGVAFRDQMEREANNRGTATAHWTSTIAAEPQGQYTGSLFDMLPQAGAWARMMSNMSERELFSEMAQDGPNVTSSYSEEYDRRHIKEYNQACDEIQARLERELPSEDRLLELLQDAEAQWADGAYKDERRTGVLAAIDTLSRALDEERAELPRVEEDVQAEGSQYTDNAGAGLLGEGEATPYDKITIGDIINRVNVLNAKHNCDAAVLHKKMTPDEMRNALNVTDSELTDEDAEAIIMKIETGNSTGGYSALFNKILIFADNINSEVETDDTFFHERAHRFIARWKGTVADMMTLLSEFYNDTKGKPFDRWKKEITNAYKEQRGAKHNVQEEYFVNILGKAMAEGRLDELIEPWLAERGKEIVEEYLNEINYVRAEEQPRRNAAYRQHRLLPKSKSGGRGYGGNSGGVAPSDEDLLFNDSDDDVDVAGFDAGELTFQEKITAGMLKAAADNRAAVAARVAAMRALGGNLSKLRQAMARQREYDRGTVDSIVRLARSVMESGYFRGFSPYEVKRLMSLINHAAGREDITKQAGKVVDLLLKHQLLSCENLLHEQMRTRGSKLNSQGVEVQAGLDIEGQRMVGAMKHALNLEADALQERINNTFDRMFSPDQALADVASAEYQGLLLAQQYIEEIKGSKQEENELRQEMKNAKEDLQAGTITREQYNQFVAETENAIRENRLERVAAYDRLTTALGAGLSASVQRAKEWRDAQRERVNEIRHNANSDLEGVPADEHVKPGWMQRAANWSIVRFFMKPLATFDYMLRMLGSKNVNGEGYLWQRFMGGWTEATEREWRNLRAAHKALDEKASEVFGKKMRWSDLFTIERKMPGMDVSFWDAGEEKIHHLTQGNLLYIYMVNKMSDGRMKLRKMGINEEDAEAIRHRLDPRFIELADWLQEEFLVNKRNEYNAVYQRMFGASMAAIEHYFPLKINSRSRGQEEDLSSETHLDDNNIGSTITGSIIKRKRNSLPLDVTGADAFDVVLGHLQDMEHWAAFAEFNRDLNTLLSYKRFRNRLLNMSSVRFGSGKTLWMNFKRTCAIASGAYRPKMDRDSVDTTLVNVAKGVTAAKISFRIYTALKQLLSYPAYLSEASGLELIKSSNPIGAVKAWNWALDNLPGFAQRWQSRQAGDSRLRESDADWGLWRNKIVETAGRWGMSPNAFIDGLTVAMGAKAIYETKLKRYRKAGYPDEQAKRRALRDASISYNETQQSNANAYLSAMQLDRSAASVALTVFRNASMGYQRRMFQAMANLKHVFTPGYKAQALEFMTKQMVRDGLNEQQAKQSAERIYRRAKYKNLADVAIFGWVMQMAWNLGPYIPYLLMGDDDDDKKEMLEDAALHALAGGVEGLSGGNVMSDVYNMWRSGQDISNYSFNLLPIMSDLQNMLRSFKRDGIEGANDLVNLMIQAGVGVNPQTLTDWVAAGLDYADGNPELSNEFGMFVLRLMSVPQSQLDKLYIDELGMNARDAQKLNAGQMAERYARYKKRHGSMLTGWAYSAEGEQKADERYMKRFETKVKERIAELDDEQLEDNFNTDDALRRKWVGQAVAKRAGGTDSYGSPDTDYGMVYERKRDYTDLAQDILLQVEKKKAKEAGDSDRYKALDRAQSELTNIKKGKHTKTIDEPGLGEGFDDEVMTRLRERRRELLSELGIM